MTPRLVQDLRFLDVFVLGPWLLYVATIPGFAKHNRRLLLLVGIGTIVVNGALWWYERQARQI